MAATFDLYTRNYAAVYVVPQDRISQMPVCPGRRTKSRLVLCCDFAGTGECERKTECRFVHADVKGLQRFPVHINYAWSKLEDVTYERLPEGRRLLVEVPNATKNDTAPSSRSMISSEYILKTRAVTQSRRLMHCAHYFFNRACRLGCDCTFVHSVYIDPEAKPGQLAPGPSELDSSIVSKRQVRQKSSAPESLEASVKEHVATISQPVAAAADVVHPSSAVASRRATHHPTAQSDAAPDIKASVIPATVATTATIAVAEPPVTIRRHNPYSREAVRMEAFPPS